MRVHHPAGARLQMGFSCIALVFVDCRNRVHSAAAETALVTCLMHHVKQSFVATQHALHLLPAVSCELCTLAHADMLAGAADCALHCHQLD